MLCCVIVSYPSDCIVCRNFSCNFGNSSGFEGSVATSGG